MSQPAERLWQLVNLERLHRDIQVMSRHQELVDDSLRCPSRAAAVRSGGECTSDSVTLTACCWMQPATAGETAMASLSCGQPASALLKEHPGIQSACSQAVSRGAIISVSAAQGTRRQAGAAAPVSYAAALNSQLTDIVRPRDFVQPAAPPSGWQLNAAGPRTQPKVRHHGHGHHS